MSASDAASLVQRLRSSRRVEQARAAAALARLAETAQGSDEILAAYGASALVQLLSGNHANQPTRRNALAALTSLASGGLQHAAVLAGAGAIPAFIQALASSNADEDVQLAAARGVWCMAYKSPERSRAAVAAGAVPALLAALQHGATRMKSQAVGALDAMHASTALEAADALAAANGVPVLLSLVRSDDRKVRQDAINVLKRAILNSDAAADELQSVAAGAIADVLPLLHATCVEQEAAAYILARLARCGGDVPTAIQAAGAIPLLVAALDSLLPHSQEESALAAMAAVALALACLPHKRTEYAAEIAAAGGIPALVRALHAGTASEALLFHAALAISVVCHAAEQRVQLAMAGAHAALVPLLASSQQRVRRQAARALAQLGVAGLPECMAAFHASGCKPALLRILLEDEDEAAQAASARALFHAAMEDADVVAEVAAAGCIPRMAALLHSTEEENCTHAAQLLGLCSIVSGAVEEAGCVQRLQHLLRNAATENLRNSAANALRCIAQARINRLLSSISAGAAPAAPPPSLRVCAANNCTNSERLYQCGGCGAVRYCSEACSRTHWREHRAECRQLRAVAAAAAAAHP